MDAPFCAEASLEIGEGLFGSAAAETDVWIVLEDDEAWAPKPLASNGLSEAVKDRLGAWLERPGSRLQLVRRPERPAGSHPKLWIACARERDPWMLEIALPRQEALLDVDFTRAVEGVEIDGSRKVEQSMYLVCTHGKRDRCCARWGMPLYQALAQIAPEGTWQTTHLGGHRFAANVVVLPHGISYGRLSPDETGALVESHERGELYDLERLRGRSCYAQPVQAAEYFIRCDTGLRGLQDLEHVATEPFDDDRWRVGFRTPDGSERAIRVAREAVGARPASCGAEPEPASRFRRA